MRRWIFPASLKCCAVIFKIGILAKKTRTFICCRMRLFYRALGFNLHLKLSI